LSKSTLHPPSLSPTHSRARTTLPLLTPLRICRQQFTAIRRRVCVKRNLAAILEAEENGVFFVQAIRNGRESGRFLKKEILEILQLM
jgi:hypothetical protein